MYLSRVELDPTRRSTMAALAAPQKLHGAVESAFTGERRRRLWRLDRLGERLYLLLLSEDVPELSGVVEQFGTGAAAETRSYDPLFAAGGAGQQLAVPADRKPYQMLQRPQGTRRAGELWRRTARQSIRSSGCWTAPQSMALLCGKRNLP